MTIPESNKCLVKNLKFEERNVHIDQKNNLGHYLVIRGKDAAYIKMSEDKIIILNTIIYNRNHDK